jgi:malate synthase
MKIFERLRKWMLRPIFNYLPECLEMRTQQVLSEINFIRNRVDGLGSSIKYIAEDIAAMRSVILKNEEWAKAYYARINDSTFEANLNAALDKNYKDRQ